MLLSLPRKLTKYLEKIQKGTNKSIDIKIVTDVGMQGMDARFLYDPNIIKIEVLEDVITNIEKNERCIAHEATHGLLLFKMGYCHPISDVLLTETNRKSAGILFTMIEDIVVNRIIQQEGFSPWSRYYVRTMKKEIKFAKRGKDYYQMFSDDLVYKRRHMIFRYVMAWGFKQYFKLEKRVEKVIDEFLEIFCTTYPDICHEAEIITKIILEHDIFTPEGHQKVIKKILKLWDLNYFIDTSKI